MEEDGALVFAGADREAVLVDADLLAAPVLDRELGPIEDEDEGALRLADDALDADADLLDELVDDALALRSEPMPPEDVDLLALDVDEDLLEEEELAPLLDEEDDPPFDPLAAMGNPP
ncbi:hypothetical protein [Aureimonas sp. Leaf454]|uniref:hypothetical protein n=1 Tax=Aureimonas sp. Leaf454 TaxID=1736381 RepID=UPI0012E34840|nr:hypothetical protein [Aureimonas sp. Leaf454]